MKYYVTLYVLLFCNITMACPDLSGEFHCDDSDDNYIFIVKQWQQDGIVHYLFNEDRVVADGIEVEYQGEGISKGLTTATCSNLLFSTNALVN